MTTPDTATVFPAGVDKYTPIRDIISAFTPDHRAAILVTENALTSAYNDDNSELDDMTSDVQDQITSSSDAALALLKAGYDQTRADLLKVQDTLDGVHEWIAGTLGDEEGDEEDGEEGGEDAS